MTGLGLIKSIFMMLNTAESRDRKNGEDKVEVCVVQVPLHLTLYCSRVMSEGGLCASWEILTRHLENNNHQYA